MNGSAGNNNTNNKIDHSFESARISFGKKLKERREKACVSKRSLAQATRISIPFIVALENGEIDKLPGRIFGRGFIKNICKIIEADSEEFLQLYESCWECEKVVTSYVSAKSVLPKKKIKQKIKVAELLSKIEINKSAIPKLPSFKNISTRDRATIASIGAGAAVISIIWVSVNFVSDKSLVKAELPVVSQTEKGASLTTPTPQIIKEIFIAPVAAKDITEEEKIAAVIKEQPVQVLEQFVEIRVESPVRIRMKFDDGKLVTKQLVPDTYKYTFNDVANFLVFDAGAVKINFNGQSIGNLGQKGRVRRISFKSSSEHSSNF
jgi:transcriptional regulator with XRE-family HTH domain